MGQVSSPSSPPWIPKGKRKVKPKKIQKSTSGIPKEARYAFGIYFLFWTQLIIVLKVNCDNNQTVHYAPWLVISIGWSGCARRAIRAIQGQGSSTLRWRHLGSIISLLGRYSWTSAWDSRILDAWQQLGGIKRGHQGWFLGQIWSLVVCLGCNLRLVWSQCPAIWSPPSVPPACSHPPI